MTLGVTSVHFTHYALHGDGFASIIPDNDPVSLDAAFDVDADLVFFGHHHPRADVQGERTRYVNPGALGCGLLGTARFALITIQDDGSLDIHLRTVPYDASSIIPDLTRRNVPAREEIAEVFYDSQG